MQECAPVRWDEIGRRDLGDRGHLSFRKLMRRKYEEGPPVLDDEALAALDAEMDEVEIQRLLGDRKCPSRRLAPMKDV